MNGIIAVLICVAFTVYLFMQAQFLALKIYAGCSLIVFLLYWKDKRAAITGTRRIPETNLHIMALLGGWPGALAAQQLLRHKTKKLAFQSLFIITIAVNIVAFVLIF